MCKYINKTELAARYQISLGTVKNMMRKRVLPYLKMVFRLKSHSKEAIDFSTACVIFGDVAENGLPL